MTPTAPCTLLEMAEYCERWFTQHSPTADLVPVQAMHPGNKAIHPMLEMLRTGLAAAKTTTPQFIITIQGGLLASVHTLNGQTDAHYLLVDMDAVEISEEENEENPNWDTDSIIRERLQNNPDEFLRVCDGTTNDPATLFAATVVR